MKLPAYLLILAMVLGLLAGCGGAAPAPSAASSETETASVGASASEEASAPAEADPAEEAPETSAAKEGAMLASYGIQGVDYDYNENGDIYYLESMHVDELTEVYRAAYDRYFDD